VIHEGTGKAYSTIPPSDFSYYEVLNEIVQNEPATSPDPELMGPLAAIGIVKGKPFAPDARMKKILTEAAALGNATSRTLFINRARRKAGPVIPARPGGIRCLRVATRLKRRSR
jgi:hypothetical protein